MAYRFV